jgi:hypothetical protein
MRFKVSKRMGEFGKLNTRNENHGSEKVPAADITIKYRGTKRDLDILLPLADRQKISTVYYDEHGHLQVPFLSPFPIHRTPENVKATFWDQATKPKSPLEFKECRIKNISVTLHDKRNIDVSLMVQLHDDPERDTARLRRLADQEREFELIAMQDEIFDEEQEEDDSGQGNLDVEEGDGDEDDEDDEGDGEEDEEEEDDED